jgi:triosephosphate isomerase
MKYIIANWKMNPASEAEAVLLTKASDVPGLIIAPPFPFISVVAKTIKSAALGAQDLFWGNSNGAYTGEVSAEELKSLGVKYVIVGHSERRLNLGETDEMVAKKIKTALEAGLTPILCVGESAEERAAGKTEEVVARELRIGLSLLPSISYKLEARSLIVAYEPIWAIGTGTPDTPQNMLNMVSYIQKSLEAMSYKLKADIIYGGSVTSRNAAEFLKHKEIAGVLVGGASLKPEEINQIVAIANKYN